MAQTQRMAGTIDVPVTRRARVARLALPAVGEQLLNTLVGLSDTFLVGHLSAQAAIQLGYTSTVALTGVGLANQIVWLVTVLFGAVGVGATAVIARARGANDPATASRATRQSLLVGLALGLAAMVLTLLFASATMDMLGADAEVKPLGSAFLQIVALTFGPAAVLFLGTAALRGMGDTKTPLVVMLGVNVINIVLSWLLINGNAGFPVLGVTGTAIGAAVARGTGGVVLVVLLLRGRSGLKINLDLRPDWAMIRRITHIGLPSGAEQLVFQGAMLVFARFVNGLGTTAYAAHNIVINLESLSFLPGMGYAIAASALVGQQLGAGKPAEAQADAYEAQRQGLWMMTGLGILMALFPHQWIGVMTNDPGVAQVGALPMVLAGLLQPFLAINFIMSGGLRGAGDTSWPLYTKIISTWGIRLPLVLLLINLGFGLTGVWIAMATDFAVQGALAWWRFQQGRWKTKRV